jgi:hypothetical protein
VPIQPTLSPAADIAAMLALLARRPAVTGLPMAASTATVPAAATVPEDTVTAGVF